MCILVILHIFELAEAAAGVSWNVLTVPTNYGVPSCIWQRLMRLETKRSVQNATAAKCQSNYCQLDKRWKCARLCGVTANSVSLIVFSGTKLVSNYVIPLFPQADLKITREFSHLCSADGTGSSLWGSLNGPSQPLSQTSRWPLRSLRDFLRGKRPVSCPLILLWIRTEF